MGIFAQQPRNTTKGTTALHAEGFECSKAQHCSGLGSVFYGLLLNHDTLCKQLDINPSASHAQVLLEGFAAQGREFLRALEGGFSFVIVDPQEEALIFGRDPIGQRPLYLWHDHKYCCVASEMRLLVAQGKIPTQLHLGMLGEYALNVWHTPNETLLRGVERVTPNLIHHWHAGSISTELLHVFPEELTPTGSDPSADFVGAADQVVQLLQDSLERYAALSLPTGISFSGGIDSSAVATLAKEVFARHRTPAPHLLTLRCAETLADESTYVEAMRAQLSLEYHDINSVKPPHDWLRSQIARTLDLPAEPNAWLTHLIRTAAREQGISLVLTGYGGDELSSGIFSPLPPRSTLQRLEANSPFLRWLAQGTRGFFPHMRWYPSWCTAQFFRATQIESRLLEDHALPYKIPAQKLGMWRVLMGPYAQYLRDTEHREAAFDRVQLGHPYFSTALVQLFFSLPDSLLCQHGTPKAVVRKGLGSRVPKLLSTRSDKAEFSYIWVEALQEAKTQSNNFSNLRQLDWFTMKAIDTLFSEVSTKLLEQPSRAKSSKELSQLWNLYALDELLNHLDPSH